MNALILTAALLALGAPDVQTDSQSKTQLYVKTTPPGATVTIDGKILDKKSDNLFDISAGSHNLSVKLEGHAQVDRAIEAKEGEITRVEIDLNQSLEGEKTLSYVGDSSEDRRSFADSGHAVQFTLPSGMKSISAVKLYGSRYGYPQAPQEDFHLYLLDENQKVLEHIKIPYRKAVRAEMQWHTFEFPAVQVPEKFFVAFWFNAEATKGVYVGLDKNVKESHSFAGLPDKGYNPIENKSDWMIRAVVSSKEGKQPTRPKVSTYEPEKAADTESEEALPSERTWNDASGAFSVDAQFVGVEDGKVKLKKPNGKIIAVPLDNLSQEDKDFVAQQNGSKAGAAAPGVARESVELKHDDGKMASKSSMAGGGHAVRFEVDNDSSYVTSVSLHGSRYGEPRPPRDSFSVWICDENFKQITTFKFPYSSYTRGDPSWKTFRIRPTKVPQKFIVCFGFNPHQTKGVYVSYDAGPSEKSLIGLPGAGREPEPFTKGNWMIRCKVEKR
jgi:hypothetical protein